ncbi:MAG: hypothetical protein ACK4J0_00095 [Candidatus Anstonellaceae archaeon]
MALSLFLWSEQSSLQYLSDSEKFRVNSLQLPFSFISENNVNKIANISAIYAVNKLADALIQHPEKIKGIKVPANCVSSQSGGDDCIMYVNSSIFELMFYGNTSGYLLDEFSSPQKYFYQLPQQNLTYNTDEKIYTLSNYFDRTSALAKSFGFDLSWGKPESFSIKHDDYRTLRVIFNIPVKLSSKYFNMDKKIKVNTSFAIDGLPDPYLAVRYRQRLDFTYNPSGSLNPPNGFTPINYGPKPVPYKNVYFSSYQNPSQAAAKLISSGSQGLGWFYGPVVTKSHKFFSDTDPIYNKSKINQFIFATNNPDEARRESQYFGAVILYGVTPYFSSTNQVQQGRRISEEQNCIWCIRIENTLSPGGSNTIYSFYKYPIKRDIPFIITNLQLGTLLSSVKPNYRTGLKEVLITSNFNIQDICSDYKDTPPKCSGKQLTYKNNQYSKASFYNLDGPRDMAICGFYLPSEYGLSYLQRFTNLEFSSSPSIPISKYGIESFDVGSWAGGYLSFQYGLSKDAQSSSPFETSSRIDYHFLLNDPVNNPYCRGIYIKGMPGCKDSNMCSSLDPYFNSTGRFSLTNKSFNPTFRYNLFSLTIPTNYPQSDCR